MEDRWDDIGRGKLKYPKQTLSQCPFERLKFHMYWYRQRASVMRGRQLNTWTVTSDRLVWRHPYMVPSVTPPPIFLAPQEKKLYIRYFNKSVLFFFNL